MGDIKNLKKWTEKNLPKLKKTRKHMELAWFFYELMVSHFKEARKIYKDLDVDLTKENLATINKMMTGISKYLDDSRKVEDALVPNGKRYVTKEVEEIVKETIKRVLW